jgi:hypothetical protein
MWAGFVGGAGGGGGGARDIKKLGRL